MSNFYDLLGISKAATPEEIKLAYRRLAMKHHPDRNESDPEGLFQAIAHAYSVLSDEKKRKAYDLSQEQLLLGHQSQDSTVQGQSLLFVQEMLAHAKQLHARGKPEEFILGVLVGKGAPEKLAKDILRKAKAKVSQTGVWRKRGTAFLALAALGSTLAVAGVLTVGRDFTNSSAASATESLPKAPQAAQSPLSSPAAQSPTMNIRDLDAKNSTAPLRFEYLPVSKEFDHGRKYFEDKALKATHFKTLNGPNRGESTHLFYAIPAEESDYNCVNCAALVVAYRTTVIDKTGFLQPIALGFFGAKGAYEQSQAKARFISYGINKRALLLHDLYADKGTQIEIASLFNLDSTTAQLIAEVTLREKNLGSEDCRTAKLCQDYQAQFAFDRDYSDVWPMLVRTWGHQSIEPNVPLSIDQVRRWGFDGEKYNAQELVEN